MLKVNRFAKTVIALVMLLAAAAATHAGAIPDPPRYALTVVGGPGSLAYDVNLRGDVVGRLAVGGTDHAFLYAGGVLADLGTGGADAAAARHVNDSGQVVGTLSDAGGGSGFLYSGGSLARLEGSFSAYGINNSGTITGVFGVTGSDGFAYPHAYRYAAGVYTDVGTLIDEGGSYGYAINDGGAIAGAAEWAVGTNRPTDVILYQDGVLRDLGAFAGPWSYGYSINDLGHIVGSGTIEAIGGDLYPRRALLYADGVLQNLGSLAPDAYSTAFDINNLGQVVGAADTADGLHGFLYEDGTMLDLNTLIDPASGWTVRDAQAINDLAQIAGTACRGEICQAVRLDLVPQVPEPAGWAMYGIGAGLLLAARRRFRSQRWRWRS
jgi:probable HAF family extracellular repeat protein